MNKNKLTLQTLNDDEIVSTEEFTSLRAIERYLENKIEYFALRAIWKKCNSKTNSRLQGYNQKIYQKYRILNIELTI